MAKTYKAGLLLFILTALLLHTPIGIIARLANPPADVQINHLEGTLWQGHIRQLGFKGHVIAEDIHWTWQPAAIKSATLAWQFDGPDNNQMTLTLSRTGWKVDIEHWAVPLQPLLQLLPKLNGLGLSGSIIANQQTLTTTTPYFTLSVPNLRSKLANQIRLGSYQATIRPNDGQGELSTLSGPLMLQGRAHFNSSGHGELNLNATSTQAELASLLESIGTPDNNDPKSITMSF